MLEPNDFHCAFVIGGGEGALAASRSARSDAPTPKIRFETGTRRCQVSALSRPLTQLDLNEVHPNVRARSNLFLNGMMRIQHKS